MPLGDNHSITARNYYAWRDFGNLLPTLVNGIVDLDREFTGGGFSYSYDGIFLDRPNRLVAGIDFDDQDDERRRYNNINGVQGPLGFDQNEHVTSAGVFLQNELSVSERLQLTMGVRFDEVEFEVTDRYFADGFNDSGSKKFDDTSPMVGVVFELRREHEYLRDVLERVRDADDHGIQQARRDRRLQPAARAADCRQSRGRSAWIAERAAIGTRWRCSRSTSRTS